MSEFRRFCIGSFVGCGLFSAAMNRGLEAAPGNVWVQMLFVGFFIGCVTVACFGKRGGSHEE